jgi:patatin-like phospholipase/acyl hydrolase
LSNKYDPVYEHISKANRLLADREAPDYENSIKESISGVEALCEILTGIKGKEASLGKMIKQLEDNGIQVDIIGGTSSGSMIAMLYASGYSPYNIYTLFKKYSADIARVNTKPIIKSYMLNKRITLKG